MKKSSDSSSNRHWLSSRTSIVVLTALGLFFLIFQVNQLLTSSFRIELFGVEILEVKHLDDKVTEETSVHREHHVVRRLAPPGGADARNQTNDEVFVVVEQMPELIGGLAGVQRAIRYPEVAKRAGIEGRVIVQFIVDERGRVIEPKIVRGIGGGCDEESLRVVQQVRFRPGTQGGKAVKVKMSLPFTFRLG